jgi:hypothetical protein
MPDRRTAHLTDQARAAPVADWVRRWCVPGYALGLAVLITGPLLRPGYLLLRDAVSTPRSYLSDAALGLSEAAPRAVPQDVAIAWASHLIDGGLVVKALLLTGIWLAGWGAARLTATVLPDTGLAAQFVAATVAVWNPYVAERLLQGHWSLLVGYGCLPWAAGAMLGLRTDGTGWRALAFWLALAGLTPTGLLLAAVVALACVAAPGPGRPRLPCALVTVVLTVVAALPWLAASMIAGSLSSYQAAGAPGLHAFAARAEPGLGTLGSLAGLGGIWNAEAVPVSRTTAFAGLAVVATVVLLAVVILGLPVAGRRPGARPLLILAAVAVTGPALLATGPGLTVLRTVIDAAPGLGVLRDGQKWVAAAMPGYALAAAGSVLVVRAVRPAVVGAVVCAAVLAVLPDLAWGVGSQVRAVQYPSGWEAVAAKINEDPRPVAVLPADTMRQFGWAGKAPVIDPLPRWVRADVLATGDLVISGRPVHGEGSHARSVQRLLLSGAPAAELAAAGVGWVVVERSTGETGSAARTLATLPVVFHDDELTLYRVGGDGAGATAGARRAMLAVHAVWLAMLIVGATGLSTALNRGAGLRRHR